MKLDGGQGKLEGGLRTWNKQISNSHVPQPRWYLLCFLFYPVGAAQVERCFHPGHPKEPGTPVGSAEQGDPCSAGWTPHCSRTEQSHLHRVPIANLGILACPLEAAPSTWMEAMKTMLAATSMRMS